MLKFGTILFVAMLLNSLSFAMPHPCFRQTSEGLCLSLSLVQCQWDEARQLCSPKEVHRTDCRTYDFYPCDMIGRCVWNRQTLSCENRSHSH